MTEVTQRSVWEFLLENGPATFEEIREEFGSKGIVAIRKLKESGHVSFDLDRDVDANEVDELRPLPGPLGAGLGQTVKGDKPPKKL